MKTLDAEMKTFEIPICNLNLYGQADSWNGKTTTKKIKASELMLKM